MVPVACVEQCPSPDVPPSLLLSPQVLGVDPPFAPVADEFDELPFAPVLDEFDEPPFPPVADEFDEPPFAPVADEFDDPPLAPDAEAFHAPSRASRRSSHPCTGLTDVFSGAPIAAATVVSFACAAVWSVTSITPTLQVCAEPNRSASCPARISNRLPAEAALTNCFSNGPAGVMAVVEGGCVPAVAVGTPMASATSAVAIAHVLLFMSFLRRSVVHPDHPGGPVTTRASSGQTDQFRCERAARRRAAAPSDGGRSLRYRTAAASTAPIRAA